MAISVAVRWHLRYGLSYRDVRELRPERGVTVDHASIYQWVQQFAGAAEEWSWVEGLAGQLS